MGFDALLAWMLTYFVHSTVLLVLAWLTSRFLGSRRLAAREMIWRVALIGGLVTATMQYATSWEPLAGSRSLSAAAVAADGRDVVSAGSSPTAGIDLRYAENGKQASAHIAALPPTRVVQTEPRVVPIALTIWLMVSSFLLGRLSLALLGLRRRLSSRVPVVKGRLFRVFRRFAAAAGVKPSVRLSRSDRIRVPLARGLRRGEVCVPVQVQVDLDQDQQETVLAHELAHLRRRDPLWLLSARLLECVLFFQPLNVVARKKLQQIAELRCDDWAVERTGRPMALASCLTRVAEWGIEGHDPLAAVSMAGSGSQLGRRVHRLLEREYAIPDAGIPGWLRIAVPAMLLVVTLAAPGVSGSDPAEPKQTASAPPASVESAPPTRPAPAPVVEPAVQPHPMVRPAPVAHPEAHPEHVVAPQVDVAPRPRAHSEVLVPVPAPTPVPTLETLPTSSAPSERVHVGMTAPELDELARHLAQLEGVLEDEARALAETAEEFAMARLEAVARSGEMEVIEIEELEKLEALGESMRMSLGARDAEIAAQRALLETEMEKLVARFEGERGVIEEQVAKRLEALGDPERRRLTKERIERQNRRIEERAARIAAEVADRERLLEDASLAAEEMDRLREEARSQAEAARPSLEEMRELHEELRREVDLMRPNLEEQRRVREELRREVDELRERFREDLEQNLEKLRELSASSDAL